MEARSSKRDPATLLAAARELQQRHLIDDARRAYRDAERACRDVLAATPGLARAHYLRGVALAALERHEEAGESYRRAVEHEPNDPWSHYALGNTLKALGDLAEARPFLERAVALAPDNGWFHRDLVDCKRVTEDDPQLAAMEALDRQPTLDKGHHVPLHFALGKAYADLGRHEDAFRHWQAGHALQARTAPYDERTTLWLFQQIAAVFTPELLRQHRGAGHSSRAPIFVLGMPRSGTTLVEQILASHPAVFGAGEIPDLPVEAGRLGGDRPFTEKVCRMTSADFRDLGTRYVARLTARDPRATRITDKMPSNFLFVGLIHLALPQARIIHVRRDPLDTCFSCYSNFFEGAPQTHDLASLGRYHRAYSGLMAHWRRVLPDGALLEIDYERLVSDVEGDSRRIVAYCGLEWDARCLEFAKNRRAVSTLSATQVRQPVHQQAIGRARPYMKFLNPLVDALLVAPRAARNAGAPPPPAASDGSR
jgi:tetratricopeptide (TPR) repeat protein